MFSTNHASPLVLLSKLHQDFSELDFIPAKLEKTASIAQRLCKGVLKHFISRMKNGLMIISAHVGLGRFGYQRRPELFQNLFTGGAFLHMTLGLFQYKITP